MGGRSGVRWGDGGEFGEVKVHDGWVLDVGCWMLG